MVNTTYHVAGITTLAALPAAKVSFCLTAEDRPVQLQPYGRHGLVTSAPTVNLEAR